jgi:lycopene cyclase domain-containing protein
MNLYLILDLAVLFFPLVLSFDRKVAFYRKWPAVFMSILIVGAFHIVWDVLVTQAGHWSFSEKYAGDFRILGLPIPELVFFIVVPYACLFIYEVVRAYFRERTVRLPRSVLFVLAGVFAGLALVFRDNGYTAIVASATALLFLMSGLFFADVFRSSWTWLFFAISYVPFLLANGVLTALPVVIYNPLSILGIRIYTIPLEDFFYSFSMLGFNLLVHLLFRRIWVRE